MQSFSKNGSGRSVEAGCGDQAFKSIQSLHFISPAPRIQCLNLNPALITRHMKEKEMKRDAARAIATLKEGKANVNSQV
jgi:hypothetical protein